MNDDVLYISPAIAEIVQIKKNKVAYQMFKVDWVINRMNNKQ